MKYRNPNNKYLLTRFVLLILVPLFVINGVAQDVPESGKKKKSPGNFRETFRDTLDNAFDISRWITEMHGFLPLPTLSTEPALGYGGNLALVFFHPTRQSIDREGTGKQQLALPSMSVAGGLYTANGTWAVYGGHYGSYLQDRLRVALFSGWLNININFYLAGPMGNEHKLKFNFRSLPIFTSIAYRLGRSKWFGGVNYSLFHSDITLQTDVDIPKFDSLNMQSQLGGATIVLYLQDFDNSFTPNRGTKLTMKYGHNDTWLGSDYRYNTFNVEFLGFGNWWKPLVSGFRVQAQGIYGDFPFYTRPFVSLRGIPSVRYQGDFVATLETEQRFNITSRWAVTGFVGFGVPFNDWDELRMSNAKWAGGGGFRYLLARWFNMYMGIDVAKGPLSGDWAWYIILGSNWLGR
ncbi:MAG: hypothetical protein P8100_02200 [bacterium]